MKHESLVQRFLRKLKQKNIFNENEYNKLYSSGSDPTRIYGSPKVHKFYSSDSFPKPHLIVSSEAILIIILPVFFAIFFHLSYLMITLAKTLFLLFLKLRMQIFPYHVTSFLLIFHFKKPLT